MDVEQFKEDVRQGRIPADRLADLLVWALRQLEDAKRRIQELEGQLKQSPTAKLEESYSVAAEEKRQAAKDKKPRKSKRSQHKGGRKTKAEKIAQAVRTEAVYPEGVALGQLAKALTTCEEHADPEIRERARTKVSRWLKVFEGLLNGSIAAGSRTPISGVPAWATLEVVTGGFATGELLAGGELRDHERRLLSELPTSVEGNERQTLNSFFVTEEGMARLRDMLSSGRYEIEVPEEGALLVVAWLLGQGKRRWPEPSSKRSGRSSGSCDSIRSPPSSRGGSARGFTCRMSQRRSRVSRPSRPTRRSWLKRKPSKFGCRSMTAPSICSSKPWTASRPILSPVKGPRRQVEGGWPCRVYPAGWRVRAQDLLDEYAAKRRLTHALRKAGSQEGKFSATSDVDEAGDRRSGVAHRS